MKVRKPEKGERESRRFQAGEIRAADDTGEISGYAAVFDQPAEIWGFEEVIRPGAFKRTINNGSDVFVLWNHNTDVILGRTKNGTLDLSEDEHGLKFTARPPDTTQARDARSLIRDGFVDKMSFGFEVVLQKWTERDGQPELREILEAKLYEVSPVPMPAYAGTDVSARCDNCSKCSAQHRAEREHEDSALEAEENREETAKDLSEDSDGTPAHSDGQTPLALLKARLELKAKE